MENGVKKDEISDNTQERNIARGNERAGEKDKTSDTLVQISAHCSKPERSSCTTEHAAYSPHSDRTDDGQRKAERQTERTEQTEQTDRKNRAEQNRAEQREN
jgi:hypothetical protein